MDLNHRDTRQVTIVITLVGSVIDAHHAASAVMDTGVLQEEMAAHASLMSDRTPAFTILDVKVTL